MSTTFTKFTNTARIFILRYRLRSKLIDLQALSVQQNLDLYLGDVILGQIRALQKELESCSTDAVLFRPRSSQGIEDGHQL